MKYSAYHRSFEIVTYIGPEPEVYDYKIGKAEPDLTILQNLTIFIYSGIYCVIMLAPSCISE